jgi:putative DNA methylase
MGRKLIEVALPLDAINKEAAREKSIRHGHPSTLHLWWARRPLAAARAVLFASIVDDPGDPDYTWPAVLDEGPWTQPERTTRAGRLHPPQMEEAAPPRQHSESEIEAERTRLHDLLSILVKWESSTNEVILGQARAEIYRATGGNPPPVLDPFAGGGSIPLEAQRLGLEAHASDLNPVAVLINKALIEIPPKFAGQPPVNSDAREGTARGMSWQRATGLAADIRYYGEWMRDEAEKRIGDQYPKVTLPAEKGGGEATVIAWLWARTVTCPNPACGADMPLVSSFWLSKKKGREAWMEPSLVPGTKHVRFTINHNKGEPQADTINRRGGRCVVCQTSVAFPYIRSEGRAGRMSQQLMAIVAEGSAGRTYVEANEKHAAIAARAEPLWKPETPLPNNLRDFKTPNYGLTTFGDLFTDRQLVALTVFSDLVGEARERIMTDAIAANLSNDNLGIAGGGRGARAYADAVATYLAFAVDRMTDYHSSICSWHNSKELIRNTFGRQAIPMIWDFAEANPLSGSAGNLSGAFEWVTKVISHLVPASGGIATQADATSLQFEMKGLISTDPPYYDNIGYADLSDFFYIWLRRSLASAHPDLFRTLLVPKKEELVATPYRFKGGRYEAEEFFETGLQAAFRRIGDVQDDRYPMTVYYAYKQAESGVDDDGNGGSASTGWETMLEGLVRTGFSITGTWPMRTELANRMIGSGTNALASSVVLACRLRPESAPTTTRRDFLRELRRELPAALKTMQAASIAPVDLAQAAIGPGMAIYTRYSGVLEPTGDRLRVRTALQLINQVLDEVLAEQDAEHDRDTGWAIAWFEQSGMTEALYGLAETLATARNVSVSGLVEAGILRAGRGKVKLLSRDELLQDWDPATEKRLTDWEITQYLIRALESDGIQGAAALKRRVGPRADLGKDLAYRLYTICERKGWSQEALSYNGLVVSWPEISRVAADLTPADYQAEMTLGD